MTEKRLCEWSLTGFDVLTILHLAKQGKKVILVDDNTFKVVTGDEK